MKLMSLIFCALSLSAVTAFAQYGGGRDPGRGGRHGGWDRPEHGRPHRPPPRRTVCWAEDRWGRSYEGWGPNRRWATAQAVERCEARSNRRCRPAGCRG